MCMHFELNVMGRETLNVQMLLNLLFMMGHAKAIYIRFKTVCCNISLARTAFQRLPIFGACRGFFLEI